MYPLGHKVSDTNSIGITKDDDDALVENERVPCFDRCLKTVAAIIFKSNVSCSDRFFLCFLVAHKYYVIQVCNRRGETYSARFC